jgi:hypothetical protein
LKKVAALVEAADKLFVAIADESPTTEQMRWYTGRKGQRLTKAWEKALTRATALWMNLSKIAVLTADRSKIPRPPCTAQYLEIVRDSKRQARQRKALSQAQSNGQTGGN